MLKLKFFAFVWAAWHCLAEDHGQNRAYGGVLKWGNLQNGWFSMENPILSWMIWGYPYFRKPPYGVWRYTGLIYIPITGLMTIPQEKSAIQVSPNSPVEESTGGIIVAMRCLQWIPSSMLWMRDSLGRLSFGEFGEFGEVGFWEVHQRSSCQPLVLIFH